MYVLDVNSLVDSCTSEASGTFPVSVPDPTNPSTDRFKCMLDEWSGNKTSCMFPTLVAN